MQLFSWQGFQIEIRRRAYQRTLSLRVPAPGLLRISCPSRLKLSAILSFIEEKKTFIEACEEELKRQYEKASVKEFKSGEMCPFLGLARQLEILRSPGRPHAELSGDKILVHTEEESPQYIQGLLIRFYQKAGKNYLKHLVNTSSRKMDLYPSGLSFRSQRTRWGSCTSQGQVSLNWRLVAAPSEVAEYVVVHELAHLVHQNHSREFWNLVERFSPHYKIHRRWLREHQIQFEFLDPRYVGRFL